MKLNINNEQVQIFRRYIANSLSSYCAILLAFSGGLDSTVLLDVLVALRNDYNCINRDKRSLKLSLRVVHINHMMNNYADNWAEHCAQECRKYDVNFNLINVVVDSTSQGIEAAARNARYKAMTTLLKNDEVLLTAHHQNDQIETLLLALKRGSGPAGLAAMPNDSLHLGHRLVRPLLQFSKAEIKKYALARNLHWIEDQSNNDLRFDRNFLRLNIMPSLCQRWPHFISTAARSAQLCAEQEKLLDELLKETLVSITASDMSLRLAPLTSMSMYMRAALLRRWLKNLDMIMPTRAQLIRLWQEVVLSRRDAIAKLKLNDYWFIRRFRNRLYVVPYLIPLLDNEVMFLWPLKRKYLKLPAELGKLYRYQININNLMLKIPFIKKVTKKVDLKLGWQKFSTSCSIYSIHANNPNHSCCTFAQLAIVRAPLSNERVSVRFGSVDGLIYIVGRNHGRTLKKIWQELHIPPWQRNRIPLLYYNDELIAALGVFITIEGMACKHLTQWQLIWITDNNRC